MNRARFFDAVRKNLFGGSMLQEQVDGTNAILDSCIRHDVTDQHHVADILAQVFHETGGYMLGIKETVMPSHKDKRPSDATVKARLEAAWKSGKLPWVKTAYWRAGWFGRGPIQVTHEANYLKVGKAIGVDLVSDPNRILDPVIGADSAVVGMSRGLYTGKKLSSFRFPECLNAKPAGHPRRIVNGNDGTDAKITGLHREFYAAIEKAGGWDASPEPVQPPSEPAAIPQPPDVEVAPAATPARQIDDPGPVIAPEPERPRLSGRANAFFLAVIFIALTAGAIVAWLRS